MNDEQLLAARGIAQLIADFRREYVQLLVDSVKQECDEVVSSGYDPAAGRGRGSWWADGELP